MVTSQHLAKASLGLILVFVPIHPALSQITANGVGTVINPQGNQINIIGGTQAGANLFHSFQDFNLTSSQIANFLSNPQIQNILARVNGGNPSVINGLLQVSGGNSHLFLINPSGIIFGANARLNVPASFTATTANNIGFGNNNLFNAFGDNNFSALIGNPNSFLFTTTPTGSIVNAGNLSVTPGQGISLIGGNVINTGNINAGNITLAAVPGTNRVRISQPGQLLSLEIVLPVDGVLRAVDIPTLLTDSELPGIQLTLLEQVQVAGTTLPNQQGLAVVSGRIDVSNPLGNGGTVQVLGNRVVVLNARINANGVTGGGTIRLGGEYLGGRDTGIAPALRFNSQMTFVDANSFLRANAINTGDGGRIIVWADDTTRFYGNIFARGGVNGGNGGFAEVSGAQTLTFAGNANLSAPRGSFGILLLDPLNIFINSGADALGGCMLPNITLGCDPGDITISEATLEGFGAAANVILEASNNIIIGTLADNILTFAAAPGGSITFKADADSDGVGSFSMNPGDTLRAQGRNITINAASITAGRIDTSSGAQPGGDVTLSAPSGSISTSTINTESFLGKGGKISINASQLFKATGSFSAGANGISASISSYAPANAGGGGAISITQGGGTSAPFIVGGATSSGTSAAITSGAGACTITSLTAPFGVFSSGNISITTNNPPPPPVNLVNLEALIRLFSNPPAPPTPPPVIVGEPIIEQPPELPIPPPPPPELPPEPPIIPPPPPPELPPESPTLTRGQENEVNRILQQQQVLVPNLNPIPDLTLDTLFGELDRSFTADFEEFFRLQASQDLSFEEVQRLLRAVRDETGVKPAIIYFFFSKTNSDPNAPTNNQAGRAAVERSSQFPSPDDQLEILMILETGEPIRKNVGVSRREVVALTNRFRSEITAYRTSPRAYLAPSQQLYKWLIAPIEKDLQEKEIDNLNFILDQGLRSLPIAALHDGEKFLVEKYSLAMMPSLNLTDLRYRDIKTAPILAMGATTFVDNNPLPAVGLELAEVTKERGSIYFLNDQFTTANLRQQHQQQGRQILHLATHGVFQGDSLNDSYIQLWDRRLTLGQLPELGLSNPVIDLLVLSACQTALGNREAELGFAGLAVQAGVRSSMASLWEVSDEATLGLMTNFYDQLATAPIKAEAVRRTQLAMLGGSVRLESGNLISETRSTPLTRELAALGDRNFSHPYFWSAFILVGNPW